MKKLLSLLVLSALALPALAQYNSKNLTISEEQETQYTFRNLRLYPIYANQEFKDAHKNVGRYLTLKKALEEKKVVITEMGGPPANNNEDVRQRNQEQVSEGGETVSKLYAENVSNDTVMILTGEVVKGGKQDRMIAQDILLLPNSGKVDLSVFCVEHHRWNYNGENGDGTKSFRANQSSASMKMRKIASVDKNQSEVWKEVENVTKKNEASTGTGTFTALDTAKKFNEENKAYVEHFKKLLVAQPDVIGVVVCTGDKVIGADMFATHQLFVDQLDNLLQSYSSEAITNGSRPVVKAAKARSFIDEVLSDESKQEEVVEKSGTMLRKGKTKLHMSKF